jgi:hypothetical protein
VALTETERARKITSEKLEAMNFPCFLFPFDVYVLVGAII